MAALEIVSLDTATPQLRAPGTGDTYAAPRAVALTPETLTGSAATSSLSIAQTWNTTGTPTALDVNVTITAANNSSLLLNLRAGGTSMFKVDRYGLVTADTYTTANSFYCTTNGINLKDSAFLSWTNGNASGTRDTYLYRDAANTLALRNGTAAQTLRWYYSFTDLSNRANGALKTASDQIIIEAETVGTGADNIDVTLTPAGTGNVRFGTHSAVAAELTTGYITIKDAGGTTRKLAVIS